MQLLQQTLDEQSPQAKHLRCWPACDIDAGELDAAAERLCRLGLANVSAAGKWLKSLTRIYLKTGEQRKLADALQPGRGRRRTTRWSGRNCWSWPWRTRTSTPHAAGPTQRCRSTCWTPRPTRSWRKPRARRRSIAPAIEEFETAIQLSPQQRGLAAGPGRRTRRRPARRNERSRCWRQLLEEQPGHAEAKQRLEKLKQCRPDARQTATRLW